MEQGNDYVVAVKGNQPRLFNQLQTQAKHTAVFQRFVDVEKTRDRITCRIVQVFHDLSGIVLDWVGLQSLIQVERIGLRQGHLSQQTSYDISSLATSAITFAQGIRAHWGIENRLHWGGVSAGESSTAEPPFKDVVFGEDKAPFRNFTAATNWSLIRNIVITIARQHGDDSLTKADRFLSHNIDQLFSLL